ncbi:Mitochondrial carrier 2 [Homalodisca vitripennis]|nr:Mitochondrial carrier 2 [Homalodisca vitripennis]
MGCSFSSSAGLATTFSMSGQASHQDLMNVVPGISSYAFATMLTAGSPPNMPHYHNMFHCWGHLQRIHQLKRGSSVLWRYYTPVSEKLLAGEF